MTPWSTPDLSDITQVVLGIVQYFVTHASPPVANVNVSAVSPETARKDSSLCQLTLYLLHVGRDPFWRNTPIGGPPAQLNSAQPLSLNLSYLLTAWHDSDFSTEQHAMSVALQAIHSLPIVNAKVLGRPSLPPQLLQTFQQWMPNGGEFTMSIEADTIDEMSRLWQAFTVPIRLSALIRVGVVFIAPMATPALPHRQPTVANVWVDPNPPNAAPLTTVTTPLLFSSGGASYTPVPPGTDQDLVQATVGPLITVAGNTLSILGYGLDPSDAPDVFLGVPGSATQWTVTPWRQTTTAFGELDLLLPSVYGTAASATTVPPPGLYSLTVSGAAAGSRSNALPVVIAPRVDNVAIPPQLQPDSTGLYSIAGAGFMAGATIVALGKILLAAAASPGPGQFAVTAAGDAISFKLPTPNPPTGAYPVLIQVNGIAAEPGWYVEVS
jgi:hypothetical protein